jgi:hypothetical protein
MEEKNEKKTLPVLEEKKASEPVKEQESDNLSGSVGYQPPIPIKR